MSKASEMNRAAMAGFATRVLDATDGDPVTLPHAAATKVVLHVADLNRALMMARRERDDALHALDVSILRHEMAP